MNSLIYGPDGHGNFLGLATLLAPLAGKSAQVNWLGTEQTALPAIIMMSVWGVGGGMIILLAGLQGIPEHYYEAATLDG
ncbi:sugar ABC transporter permease, partial [Acinetobacter baumannii]